MIGTDNYYSIANFNLTLSKSGHVNIMVIDIMGKTISVIKDEFMYSDNYNFRWDSVDNVSGVYFITVNVNNTIMSQKIVLVK